jgi:hypothetical protein
MHQVSKILFCYETLHVSGLYCAHHQELSAVHVAIGMFHAGYVAAAEESQVGTITCRVSRQNKILDACCTLFVMYTNIQTLQSVAAVGCKKICMHVHPTLYVNLTAE